MEVRHHSHAWWFSSGMVGVWALSLCGVIIGGIGGWIMLGVGLCNNLELADSSTYCVDGGWAVSGVGVVAAIGLALALPALALAVGRRGLFRLGLVLPAVLLAADVVASLVVAFAG